MNYIHERYAMLPVMAPITLSAGAAATSGYTDTQSRKTFCFAVIMGSVASKKSVKVELMASDAAAGTGAESVGEVVYTAPSSVSKHVVTVSGHVTALRGRYLAVKVTNQGTADLLASAMLIADGAVNPEDTGGTALVV